MKVITTVIGLFIITLIAAIDTRAANFISGDYEVQAWLPPDEGRSKEILYSQCRPIKQIGWNILKQSGCLLVSQKEANNIFNYELSCNIGDSGSENVSIEIKTTDDSFDGTATYHGSNTKAFFHGRRVASCDEIEKNIVIDPSDSGKEKVALLSYPSIFCTWTELSKPHAFVTFAFQINGETQHFRTLTTCKDFDKQSNLPIILGEKVVIYGGDTPKAIRREDGTMYKVRSSDFPVMYLNPDIVLTGFENPDHDQNPHPELVLEECRRLKHVKERDVCLYWQAGHQRNPSICEEISEWKRNNCKEWMKNIAEGKTN